MNPIPREDETKSPESGQRRRVLRVPASISLVIACADGRKVPARAIDLSVGGMYLECAGGPAYGESITIVVRLAEKRDWSLLPGRVRWTTRHGVGIEFGTLDTEQRRALAALVEMSAA